MKQYLATFIVTVSVAAGTTSATACEDPLAEHPHAPGQNLSPEALEIEAIRAKVLRRCGLSAKLAENRLPWYFHYEFGVELLRSGAIEPALESLQMTANLRSEPAHAVRMYGMWFVDYMPYFQMSLALAELGEWERASEAIAVSERFVEVTPADAEYEQYQSLRSLIARKRSTGPEPG